MRINSLLSLLTVFTLVFAHSGLSESETPGYISWVNSVFDSGGHVSEKDNLLRMNIGQESFDILTQLPKTKNSKDSSRYSPRTVFMVSDRNWRDVLSFVPVAIWAPSDQDKSWCKIIFANQTDDEIPLSEKCAYPLIIYHDEDMLNFDLDSPLHFIDQYEPDKIVHIGKINPYVNKIVSKGDIYSKGTLDPRLIQTDRRQIFSFWQNISEVVYVDNDYSIAMQAAQYAAYKNAPLLIFNETIPPIKSLGQYSTTCIGDHIWHEIECDLILDPEELRGVLISLTGSDRIIFTNPLDLDQSYCENLDFRTKLGSEISNLYCKDSLSASYLATAKEELIAHVRAEPSYSILGEDGWSNEDRLKILPPDIIESVFEAYTRTLSPPINEPLPAIRPAYVTYLASPRALIFAFLCDTSILWNQCSMDFIFSEAIAKNQRRLKIDDMLNTAYDYIKYSRKGPRDFEPIPFGRLFGVTVSDTQTNILRSIFTEDLIDNSNPKISYLQGADIAQQMYVKELHMKAKNVFDFFCYVHPDTPMLPHSSIYAYCKQNFGYPPIPPFLDYSDSNFFFIADHGAPTRMVSLQIDSDTLLDADLSPSVFITSSCSNLDYYNSPRTPYKPTIGISAIRAGAIGYMGFVTSAGNPSSINVMYLPRLSLIEKRTSLGKIVTLPVVGQDTGIDKSWYSITGRGKNEPFYTIVGDPTYVSVFEQKAAYVPETTACGCLDEQYNTKSYVIGANDYCSLAEDGYVNLFRNMRGRTVDVEAKEDLALLDLMFLPCIDYLDLRSSGSYLSNINIFLELSKYLDIKYLDVRGTDISAEDCRSLGDMLTDAKIICDPPCGCSSGPYFTVERSNNCHLDEVSESELSAYLRSTKQSGIASIPQDIGELDCLNDLEIMDAGLKDISPVEKLKSLYSISFTDVRIDDISAISEILSLKNLFVHDSDIGDYSPFSTLVRLDQIRIENSNLTDITFLSGLNMVSTLHLPNNPLSDISPIAGLKSLRELDLSGTKVADISPLGNHPISPIEALDLSGTRVSDISQLANHPYLEQLSLSYTQVSDISALYTIPNLKWVDLIDTRVSPDDCSRLLEFINQKHSDGFVEC